MCAKEILHHRQYQNHDQDRVDDRSNKAYPEPGVAIFVARERFGIYIPVLGAGDGFFEGINTHWQTMCSTF